MQYIPFHLKYRPLSFNELVGQEVSAVILQREIMENTVPNSYIFYGTRGTGKTTTARLLARALNCLSLVNGNPCNVCSNCQLNLLGQFPDTIEMDAGSHSGIDDARQLIDDCSFGAKYGKYKIYIIDESHNLSRRAWDALLKLIEEPHSSIKFVFCTTVFEKIPNTIVSRSQVFSFGRISVTKLLGRLQFVLDKEQIHIPPSILDDIAVRADGSLRDALVKLEQVIQVKEDASLIDKTLGKVSDREVLSFLDGIFKKDYIYLFKFINETQVSYDEFVTALIKRVCNSFVAIDSALEAVSLTKRTNLLETLFNWKTELKATINQRITNEFYIIKIIKLLDSSENSTIAQKNSMEDTVEKIACKINGKIDKVSDDLYIITSEKGVRLNIVVNENVSCKGYFCVYPTDTQKFLTTSLPPIDLLKLGIIRKK